MTFSKIILLFLSVSTLSWSAQAQITETALVRGKRFKPVLQEVELVHLVSTTGFDGKYFKIVKGKEETPISFSEPDQALKLKAATTYYHLNLMRDYWVKQMKSNYVRFMPKVTVRLEITNLYSDLGHFQHDSIDPHYNDALSIPAGEPMEGVDIPIWGNEIWFRPVKKIKTEELPESGLGGVVNPLTRYIQSLARPVYGTATNRLIQLTLQRIFAPQQLYTPFQNSVLRQAGTIAVTALILEGSKHTDKYFMEKYYYLDTAMIPEIIYHEFSHIALSDYLSLGLSTPILEGMADYFSTTFSDHPTIANKIKKYSLSMPKNGKNKNRYNPIFETNKYANSDFVLSVLWQIRTEFPEVADPLIYNARTMMQTGFSDIRHDLISSLLESCRTVCLNPASDRMKMRDLFEERGF